MSSPISFLVDHETIIIAAYEESNGKPRNTWFRLETELPELSQAMTFNTFKQYVSVFAFVKGRLDKVRQIETEDALAAFRSEKSVLEQRLRNALERLDKVTQNRSETAAKLEKALEEKDRLKALVNKGCHGLDKVRQFDGVQLMKAPGGLDKVIQARPEAPVRQNSLAVPKRISGWSVQCSKDGYYRCY
ncbi:MAG: hypothetical protein GY754_45070, partial [bacterium]|nr:hypothetical protein [bacterium]